MSLSGQAERELSFLFVKGEKDWKKKYPLKLASAQKFEFLTLLRRKEDQTVLRHWREESLLSSTNACDS